MKVLDAEIILSEIRNKIHPKKDYDSPLLLKSDIKEARHNANQWREAKLAEWRMQNN